MQTVPPAEASVPGGDVIRDQDKIMLVLAYLGILALIPLLTVKDSAYVQWHAKQGLALALVWLGWAIAASMLGFIPIVGWLVWFVGCLGHLGLLVLTIMGIVKAFEPNRWRIPVVSSIAEKF
ncbi:MAG TPA: hypothetical protein DFS52_26300 [Myxococcales bacterium]|nr:hypothetical protein [Myxococcales bacterium]